MSLITSMGSEFQPFFRRTLLGSAIVCAWVLDEGGGALAGMEDWTRLCADKDGEANMCYGEWIGDDDYNTPLYLRDTCRQRRVISMPDNLLG